MFELLEQRPYNIDSFDHEVEYRQKYLDRHRVYNPQLFSLIKECLAHDANERPHINELLYDTRRGLQRWERVFMSMNGDDIPACLIRGGQRRNFRPEHACLRTGTREG
jgi:hypothetical protein